VDIIETNLQDVKLIERDVLGDHHGVFKESYTKENFLEAGIASDSIQDNHSL